ncbi:unnamed protein product, partial [Laminaria digitata]
DTLYGSLALEPVILRLMDTPQFQRLHGLKQLGTSDYVYRSCTHTRFEHSVGGERGGAADGGSRHRTARAREGMLDSFLGVVARLLSIGSVLAHLAQRFTEGLRRRQPELGISVVDVMCVKIAGLLHDLGHGPFSHMWDDEFVRRAGVVWKV